MTKMVCNVRSTAEIGNNIMDTLKKGHLIYSYATNGNWINIDYSKDKKSLNGQVYKDRVELVSEYQNIPILTRKTTKLI